MPTAKLRHKLSLADEGHQPRSYSAMEKDYVAARYHRAQDKALLVAAKSNPGGSCEVEVFDVHAGGAPLYSLRVAHPIASLIVEDSLLLVGCHNGALLVYSFQV